MSIADRIQQLRKSKGVSQEELADRIGVSRQAVSKWESEQSMPDIEKIILLSDYFETTTDFLLKGIEPTREAEKKPSAAIFAVLGTVLNAIGLIFAIALWIERQTAYAVALGLMVMLLGTGVFLFGQLMNAKDKRKAKRLFALPNVWILPFIPLSCCYNLLFGFSWQLAPVPLRENSLIGFGLFWMLYIAGCAVANIFLVKKKADGR